MEYCVCQATGPHELQAVVSARIAEGWEPIGGIAVDHTSPFDTKAHQAMIRKPAPEPVAPVVCQCVVCRSVNGVKVRGRRFKNQVVNLIPRKLT